MATSTFFKTELTPPLQAETKSEHTLSNHKNKNSEQKRVQSALYWHKKPYRFKTGELDEKSLERIAQLTNAALIHYSGNCTLLANLFLYNLKVNHTQLGATNTYPILVGLDAITVSTMIFGSPLTTVGKPLINFTRLEAEILSSFKNTGERFYVTRITFRRRAFGHDLNAVVVGDPANPRVIFVDSWNTSKQIFTANELSIKYKRKPVAISLQIFDGIVKPLQKSITHVIGTQFYPAAHKAIQTEDNIVTFHTDANVEQVFKVF